MLAITAPLKHRLMSLPVLAGWDVRTGTEPADRRPMPAVDLRCAGAIVADSKTGAAMVAPEWAITLVVRRSDQAADQLDAAFAAVFESLHNWAPGTHGGIGWERMRLVRVTEASFTDDGIAGCELTFSTAARYTGQI